MKKGFLRLLCVALCMVLVMGCLSGVALADVWANDYFGSKIYEVGFGVPYSNSSGWTTDYYTSDGYIYKSVNRDIGAVIQAELMSVGESYYSDMITTPDEAKELLERVKYEGWESEYLEIQGLPALVEYAESDGTYMAVMWYVRYSAAVRITAGSVKNQPITTDDMKKIANAFDFDEADAIFLPADTLLSVSSKGDPVTVIAGKNVAFTAAFANPGRVNKKNKNDAVVWSVGKADTGEAVEGVTIDAKGQLKVDKSLAAPVDLQVKVSSELFDTSATYNISAMPVVSKVNLDPAELFFYVGTEDPQTVKASMEPATVPPIGLTWTPAKKDIVEITPVEDGTVSIKPLKAGKTDIAVKEPGGKNAKLTVNVVAPVESVELKANGAVKAGGKVKIAATLAPKNVGNKTVQWSVDVGEDIAKIDDKGQLTIAKGVASGTKITVTCEAVGAPTPVVATVELEVP